MNGNLKCSFLDGGIERTISLELVEELWYNYRIAILAVRCGQKISMLLFVHIVSTLVPN